jgi:catechol 2,3-dioxygenase-like lactoylglutathione lyase family enzyme
MSKRPYGPIIQNAFIVPDIDAAIDYWTGVMRVGPFFKFPKIEFSVADFRGKPQVPNFEAAIAYSGDLNIELIKPIGPSIFKEFLDAGRKGVQHVAAFVEDMQVAQAAIQAVGGKRVQGGTVADGSMIAYFEMGGAENVVLEIAYLKPPALGLFAAVKQAGASWDGATKILSF